MVVERGFADFDGMTSAQYHAALDLMWGVLDTSYAEAGGKDVFTLIVERVRELEENVERMEPVFYAALAFTISDRPFDDNHEEGISLYDKAEAYLKSTKGDDGGG